MNRWVPSQNVLSWTIFQLESWNYSLWHAVLITAIYDTYTQRNPCKESTSRAVHHKISSQANPSWLRHFEKILNSLEIWGTPLWLFIYICFSINNLNWYFEIYHDYMLLRYMIDNTVQFNVWIFTKGVPFWFQVG